MSNNPPREAFATFQDEPFDNTANDNNDVMTDTTRTSDDSTLDLLDVSIMRKSYLFLIGLQLVLLLASFSTDWSRTELEDLTHDEVMSESKPLNLFENIRNLWESEEYFLAILNALLVFVLPLVRLVMFGYISYMFCTKFSTTTTLFNEENGAYVPVTDDDSIRILAEENDEIRLSPWYNSSTFFPLNNSAGSNMKWAQSLLYFCEATTKIQFGQMINSTIFYWVSSNEFEMVDPKNPDENVDVRLTIKMMEGYPLFNFSTYPAFVIVILMIWHLIRWLHVFKRERLATDVATIEEASHDCHDKSEGVDPAHSNDDVTPEEGEFAEPFIQNLSGMSGAICNASDNSGGFNQPKQSFKSRFLVFSLILLSFVSWVTLFLGCLNIYEVDYIDGIISEIEENDKRNVDFWQLLRDAHNEDDGSSAFARFLPSFFIISFCFVVPTAWMISVFALEFFAVRRSDSGFHPCVRKGVDRKLYLVQRYLYVCCCDLPLAFAVNIAIIFTENVIDSTFDDYLTCIGYYKVGSAFLLVWALSNALLYRHVKVRWNHELFKV